MIKWSPWNHYSRALRTRIAHQIPREGLFCA
ncbi:hypothetical protein Gotri_002301, partial [Gossypium trilobum]|nr:hypothetical protein [Gossypium trilobum]